MSTEREVCYLEVLYGFPQLLHTFADTVRNMQISHCSSLPISSNLSLVILLFKNIHSEIMGVIQETNKNGH
jgi:hypothetical protein